MTTPVTLFPIGPIKTGITDETDSISNQEFLRAIFGDDLKDNRPIVVSFTGDPGKVEKRSWFGQAWQSENTQFPSQNNNYFSLATFRPDEASQYRRQKSRFHALYAVMLDDVGSKVAMERLILSPSWLIETSPGNYQAGYILNAPLTEGALADKLMEAIIAAGLCDPGANGPMSRLARLPVAINGKHSPPFPCQLVKWSPALRYSVDELVEGLQLEMAQNGRPKRQQKQNHLVHHDDGELVWIPRPEENIVIAMLRHRGIYKSPLGGGKHDISCPWLDEHTDSVDGGTAYFEPDDQWPFGGFKCLHGHCADRHIRDLLRHLDIEVSAARMKPTIRVVAGEIHRVVDAAERELAQSGRHYQRGGLIVCVATDPGTG
jgi:hypothetical protein